RAHRAWRQAQRPCCSARSDSGTTRTCRRSDALPWGAPNLRPDETQDIAWRGGAVVHDLTVAQRHAAGHAFDELHVVRGHDDGAAIAVQLLKQLEQRDLAGGVEADE